VYPRKLIPQRRERVNYDLCVANGTTIRTYGRLPSALTWDYAGSSRGDSWWPSHTPLIGADFLYHFGLLVDCKYNRLLDAVTSLSAPAQAASSLTPSVKVISGGSLVDTSLRVSRLHSPHGVQREVRHNTVHHIRTTTRPPVTPSDHGDWHRTGSPSPKPSSTPC
jgi:hypothetical protein